MKNSNHGPYAKVLGNGKENTALDVYLRTIGKKSLISQEEEVRLAKRIQLGDEFALHQLVEANLRFVVNVAKRFQNQGLPLEDLINEGNIGLITAAKRFDPSRGFHFITYAVWWIRQAIFRALAEQSRMIRLPVNRVTDKHTVNLASRALLHEFHREPTLEEIAEAANMTMSRVRDTSFIGEVFSSLDSEVNHENATSLLETIEDAETLPTPKFLEHSELRQLILTLLQEHPKRDADIFIDYYGLNDQPRMTLEQIGERFSLTRERARQIKERMLRWFQHPIRIKLLQEFTQKDRTF